MVDDRERRVIAAPRAADSSGYVCDHQTWGRSKFCNVNFNFNFNVGVNKSAA
jgi:hypothetical protein